MANIDKIKKLCKEKGIKQSFLCESLGLHFSFLNDVKKGSTPMTPERLEKIAEILDVNVEYLNDETEERKTYKTEKSPSTEELSELDIELLTLFSELTEEQKQGFILLAKSFIEKGNKS